MLYCGGDEIYAFEYRSVAWRLIERVLNATRGNARNPTSGQSVSAKKSVRGPTSDARKLESDTTKSGTTISFG